MKRPAEEEAPSLQRASLLIIILLPRFHPLLRSFLPAFTSKSIVAEPDGSAPFISLSPRAWPAAQWTVIRGNAQ